MISPRTSIFPGLGRTLCVLAFALLAACGERERSGIPPRHLLLITGEGIRADHVTHLGYARQTTRVIKPDQQTVLDIDHLGVTGVTFARAYAPSGEVPTSVASLVTGAAPYQHGLILPGGRIAQGMPTLAEDFRREGFVSAAFLSSKTLGREGGFTRGFDKELYAGSDEGALQAAVEWLRQEVPKGERHFTWIHLSGATLPFAGEPMDDPVSTVAYEGPVRDELPFFDALARGEVELGPADRARLRDLYDGRLLRFTKIINAFFFCYKYTFDDGALWDDSVIAFAGVSGCELAERDGTVGSSHSLVDAGLHVPIILRHINSMTGERILGEVVELTDVAPTMRSWFGLETHDELTGRDLLSLTDTNAPRPFESRPALAFRFEDGDVTGHSVRDARWRLTSDRGAPRLFDVDVDPGHRMDVSEAFPLVLPALEEALRNRLELLGSAGPLSTRGDQ